MLVEGDGDRMLLTWLEWNVGTLKKKQRRQYHSFSNILRECFEQLNCSPCSWERWFSFFSCFHAFSIVIIIFWILFLCCKFTKHFLCKVPILKVQRREVGGARQTAYSKNTQVTINIFKKRCAQYNFLSWLAVCGLVSLNNRYGVLMIGRMLTGLGVKRNISANWRANRTNIIAIIKPIR